jgi:hypothetical protein
MMWRTPTVNGNHTRKGASETSGNGLATAVKIWPTPCATEARQGLQIRNVGKKGSQQSLSTVVRLLPTPKARDYRSPDVNSESKRFQQKTELNSVVGGQLNPDWVEWLMGFPIGWTDLTKSNPIPHCGWETEPDIPRVAYKIKNRVNRLKCLGNAVVPQQIAPILFAIAEIERSKLTNAKN